MFITDDVQHEKPGKEGAMEFLKRQNRKDMHSSAHGETSMIDDTKRCRP